jgi:hypothetical protein
MPLFLRTDMGKVTPEGFATEPVICTGLAEKSTGTEE